MTDSNDKPRKTLSIARKTTPTATGNTTPETATRTPARGGKRVIRRDELPNVQKPGQPKKPPKKPANRKPRQPPKPKKTAPSELRAQELDASLNAFPVWLDCKPLALGIEKQIFRHIAELHLSASKRVVEKLLYRHTHKPSYLQAVARGGNRWNLDGTEAGEIIQVERDHAAQILTVMKD